MNAFIKAISYHLPEKVFSNEMFFQSFPDAVSQKENLLRTGIEERHLTDLSLTASDLAVEAARKLFKEHSIEPSEIDFLFFCAQEFDHIGPTTACIIHEKLQLPRSCGSLDYNLGCSGFIYGLSLAKGLIESSGFKNILLLTSSTLTKKLHKKDKSSRFVFGDGAAATIISSRQTEKGIGQFVLGTDGKGANKIIIKDGGGRYPLTEKSFTEIADEYGNITSDAHCYMDGPGVFTFAIRTVPPMINDLLKKENLKIEEIDLFIFHQANLFMMDTIRMKLNIPEEKTFYFIKNVGNTISSSIPIALSEAIKCGKAKSGNSILLAGFGVGLSWGATIIKL